MKIEVILSPSLYDGRQLQQPCTAVAVDVLRATTALCSMFVAGAQEVTPLTTLEELEGYREKGYLVAAERGGMKVEGAMLGNSPTEYATMRLDGARIAFSSTNGTVSIVKSLDNNRVAAGAFSNISALCRWILQKDDDIIVICSGWKGDPSLEDTLFAGALACKLGNHVIAVNDAANMAIDLYRLAQNDVEGYCQKASHVRRLLGLNYDNDVHFAFQEDTCGLVPTWDKATCALHIEKP